MITVHHLNNSRSQRILWLLEEIGLPYEIKKYIRAPETMRAPADLRKIHPLGKSPVITDGELVVAESGAITEYLVENYGHAFKPSAGTPEALRYSYWMHFSEGSLMPPLLIRLILQRIEDANVPFFLKPVTRGIAKQINDSFVGPELTNLYSYMDAELGKQAWFAGDVFSAADIQMSFPIEAAASRGNLDGRYPNLMRFLERISERPAYQRALNEGGEYAMAAKAA